MKKLLLWHKNRRWLPCSRLDNYPISSTSIIVEVVDPKPSYIEPNYIRLSFKKYYNFEDMTNNSGSMFYLLVALS